MEPRLGIVAGGGELPVRLAEACRARGRDVFILVIEGHGDAAAFSGLPHASIRLGEAGKGFALLHEAGVSEVVMAGPVRRPSLRELRPDWRATRFFTRIGLKALGDDGLLSAVMREFESEGFRLLRVDEVVEDLLAPKGVWGHRTPDESEMADIMRGIAVIRGLGALDIGQAVVVQQGIVLGVEAIEGTDGLIARSGGLKRAGRGPVLVKCAKPGQDRRADLPTIGTGTIANAAAAGFAGIAVEAGSTIVLGLEAVTRAADEAGLFVMGCAEEGL